MRWISVISLAVLSISLSHPSLVNAAGAGITREALIDALNTLDTDRISTGILYDRVVALSRIADYDGSDDSPPVTLQHWKQMYFEMYHASLETPAWPEVSQIVRRTKGHVSGGLVPVAFMSLEYNRIRPGALGDGALIVREDRLVEGEGDPYTRERVFTVAPLKDYTHRGDGVEFVFDADWYVTNERAIPAVLEVDFDDGLGYRTVRFGGQYRVSYHRPGRKTIRVKSTAADGTELHAGFYFRVEHLQTPNPHDTLEITATIPYNAQFGTGEAYVYLADSHDSIKNPVVVVEGFDLDNTMNWDELYHLLNQEDLLETLRGKGFDAVVLNFTDATDYVQKNSFALVELIEQVHAYLDSYRDVAIVGASMGGLCSRYALAYMETHAMEHRVRTFVSFDAPQRGANIPLGVQYWLVFFSEMSEEAAFLLSRLDTPAARQMLVYHHTDPPGATGESDSLWAGLLADLASVGEYPVNLRKVAVANGSGSQADQGFAAGDQIIDYEYNSLFVDIIGNVWAVPDGAGQIVFHGLIDIIFQPKDEMSVNVSGTLPYDNAPGGSRASMAQMDSTEAPYGDIVALHPSHCFIPTVSALDLTTGDLFYDIAGDSNLLSITTFDAVYYPLANQEHVSITPENAVWFLNEIEFGVTSVTARLPKAPTLTLLPPLPNPASGTSDIHYSLGRAGPVTIAVYDVRGRRIATLLDEEIQPAGPGMVRFDTKGLSSGVYFVSIKTFSESLSRKLAVVR